MALATYSDLVSSVAGWLWREGETQTEAVIPDMIRLAEAKFNRSLRVRDMNQTTASLAVTAGVASKPSGLRSVIGIKENITDRRVITPLPIDDIETLADQTTGALQHYDLTEDEIVFWPQVTTTVQLRYRQEIPALTVSNTTNWLFTKHPDLYLWQTLALGEAYNIDDPRVPMWKAKAAEALSEIIQEDSWDVYDDGLYLQASQAPI